MSSGDTCSFYVNFAAVDRAAVEEVLTETFNDPPEEVTEYPGGRRIELYFSDVHYPDAEVKELGKRGLTFYGHWGNTWESPGAHFACLAGDLALIDTPFDELVVGVDHAGQVIQEDLEAVRRYQSTEEQVLAQLGGTGA